MEYLTDFAGADPVGPFIRNLVDNWETEHESRRRFLRLWHPERGKLYDDELAELDNGPITALISIIHLRERVAVYIEYVALVLGKMRGTPPMVIKNAKDAELHDKLVAASMMWLLDHDLRNAVNTAVEAAQETVLWFNYQLVAAKLRDIACYDELKQLFPSVEETELRRQAQMVENYAYGRAKLLYASRFLKAMEALHQLPVREEAHWTKGLFAFTPVQIIAMGQGRMGLLNYERTEKVFTPDPLPPRETVSEGGIVILNPRHR
jgi:hypothetical protein